MIYLFLQYHDGLYMCFKLYDNKLAWSFKDFNIFCFLYDFCLSI